MSRRWTEGRVAATQARPDTPLVAMARASTLSRPTARRDIVCVAHGGAYVSSPSGAAAPPAFPASAAASLVAAEQAVPEDPSRRLHLSRCPTSPTDSRVLARSGFAAPAVCVRRDGSGCGRASCAGGTVTTLAIRPLPGAADGLPRLKRTPGFAGTQKPISFPASGLFTRFSE